MSDQAKRDKKYHGAMKAQGFRRCILWVHVDDREKLKEYANQLKGKRQNDQIS